MSACGFIPGFIDSLTQKPNCGLPMNELPQGSTPGLSRRLGIPCQYAPICALPLNVKFANVMIVYSWDYLNPAVLWLGLVFVVLDPGELSAQQLLALMER